MLGARQAWYGRARFDSAMAGGLTMVASTRWGEGVSPDLSWLLRSSSRAQRMRL
ncbi:hypothetical protein GCM10025858_34740 [Alicyclobacillus sacchari]|nr:hypothetical protein GCM10025858_34740 [Alicyclobacillus sacchari]